MITERYGVDCRMHNYIEFFSMPENVVIALMIIFGVAQGIGELLELKGKVVPEYLKVRKYFKRKREERDAIKKVPETLKNVEMLLSNVDNHYSKDNISMRDGWMKGVDTNIDEMRQWMRKLDEKLDKNSAVTLAIRIENMRNTIIDFAAYVSDESKMVTREQFKRVFKTYEEYEGIITDNGLTNGEVDIAIHIIRESYEHHLRKHNFIEDEWGLDV